VKIILFPSPRTLRHIIVLVLHIPLLQSSSPPPRPIRLRIRHPCFHAPYIAAKMNIAELELAPGIVLIDHSATSHPSPVYCSRRGIINLYPSKSAPGSG